MGWISDAGGGRHHSLQEFALPDFRFSLQLHGTHWRRVNEGWSYPDHNHPLFELNIVLEGEQVMTVEGTEYVQNEGDMLIIRPGDVHRSRVGGSSAMAYLCIHLDVDDSVFYQRIMKLDAAYYHAESPMVRSLRPYFGQLADLLIQEKDGRMDAGFIIRRIMLNILLVLAEHASPAGDAGREAEIGQPLAVLRLRERNALEKKIQNLLYEPTDASVPVDKSLLPPFRWVGLFSVMIPDRRFWTKPERFWAKILLEDSLAELGTVAVVVGEQLMSAVIFSDRFTVPPFEEAAAKSKTLLETNLEAEIRLGFGGITPAIGDIRSLYKQSLRHLGIQDDDSAPSHDHTFISRIIRLAMHHIESDYANPELSLGLLAEKLELTPNYLSSLFTSETGYTFTQHLSRMRIHSAKRLLKETNLKVYKIGEKVGYADQAYFSRLFKTIVGVSPGEYRAGAHGEQE